jgi:hypothetical protein
MHRGERRASYARGERAGRWAAEGLDRMPGGRPGGARVGTGIAADLGRHQF